MARSDGCGEASYSLPRSLQMLVQEAQIGFRGCDAVFPLAETMSLIREYDVFYRHVISAHGFNQLIALHLQHARCDAAGNQAFVLVSSLSGQSGELRVIEAANGTYRVQGDTNGDGAADFVRLIGASGTFDAAIDIIL